MNANKTSILVENDLTDPWQKNMNKALFWWAIILVIPVKASSLLQAFLWICFITSSNSCSLSMITIEISLTKLANSSRPDLTKWSNTPKLWQQWVLNPNDSKWLSVRLRTKWLLIRIALLSLKLQISCLFRARSSLIFTQL